jgi:hypothetical protein
MADQQGTSPQNTSLDVSEQSLQRLTVALQELQRQQDQTRIAIAQQEGAINLMRKLLAAKAQAQAEPE